MYSTHIIEYDLHKCWWKREPITCPLCQQCNDSQAHYALRGCPCHPIIHYSTYIIRLAKKASARTQLVMTWVAKELPGPGSPFVLTNRLREVFDSLEHSTTVAAEMRSLVPYPPTARSGKTCVDVVDRVCVWSWIRFLQKCFITDT